LYKAQIHNELLKPKQNCHMKNFLILVGLTLGICFSVSAQNIQVKGRVVDDSTGAGLPAVSVTIRGTTKGTTTGSDGSFVLSVPPGTQKFTVDFSYQGYATETRSYTGAQNAIEIKLKKQAQSLDDVVVIGYQSVRRRDLLASVSSINSKQLKDIPLNSAEEALAGRLAGVQVTGTEGSPNAQVLIRVRGGGSITQNNAPIYVVDGVQVDNALNTISPQDIESIDVLKDAAATSIYGARGSNGVVIITTKGGRNTGGKTTITYNGFWGVSKLSKELPVQTPYDYMYYQFERAKLTGDSSGIQLYGYSWDSVNKYKTVPFQDWQNTMLGRQAFQMTNNVSLSGGTDKTQYNLSVSNNQAQGVMLNSDYMRNVVAFRFDHQASEKLKIGASIRYNNTFIHGAGTSNPGSSALNFIRQIIRYRPFLLPGQTENTFDPNYYAETNANSLNLVNPVLLNNQQYRKTTTSVMDLSAYATYSFTRWLSFRSTFGFDLNTGHLEAFDDTLTNNAKSNGAGMPIASINNTNLQTINNSNVFTFNAAGLRGGFSDRNDLTVIVGEETYQTYQNDAYMQTNYFPIGTTFDAALGNMNLGTPPNSSLVEPKPTTTVVPITQLSFFGRATYSFEKKYFLSGSLRADGSSLFAPQNRWGYFPAGSAAWRISQEKFMDGVKFVNDLKLRVAYGQAGNNRIGPYQYLTQFNTNTQYGLNHVLVTGFAPTAVLANPDVKWESTTSRNIGLDAVLFSNRLSVSIDVYKNSTDNLLLQNAVPTNSGSQFQVQNVGATSNTGLELQLGGTIMQKRDLTWTGNFNISFNQNKVTSLGGVNSILFNSGWAGSSNPPDFIVQVGKPVGSMWGLTNDGFYKTSDFNYNPTTRVYTLKSGVANSSGVTSQMPMPGGLKYKGLNGDTTVSAADRSIIGNAQPKFFGGFSQQVMYKHFDLSVFINFQYGNKVYNFNKLEFSSGYTPGGTLIGDMTNRWHTVDANGNVVEGLSGGAVVGASPDSLNALNANAKIWIPQVGSSSTSFSPSSFAVEDASFIRINNITLGYTLPVSITQKIKIQRIRIYGTANNVAVITGYSGYDPEVSTRLSSPVTPGVDYSAYPRSRTYILGVNVTF
jgi:TonB-linked SusC/RagA family outer membrane protein